MKFYSNEIYNWYLYRDNIIRRTHRHCVPNATTYYFYNISEDGSAIQLTPTSNSSYKSTTTSFDIVFIKSMLDALIDIELLGDNND